MTYIKIYCKALAVVQLWGLSSRKVQNLSGREELPGTGWHGHIQAKLLLLQRSLSSALKAFLWNWVHAVYLGNLKVNWLWTWVTSTEYLTETSRWVLDWIKRIVTLPSWPIKKIITRNHADVKWLVLAQVPVPMLGIGQNMAFLINPSVYIGDGMPERARQ